MEKEMKNNKIIASLPYRNGLIEIYDLDFDLDKGEVRVAYLLKDVSDKNEDNIDDFLKKIIEDGLQNFIQENKDIIPPD